MHRTATDPPQAPEGAGHRNAAPCPPDTKDREGHALDGFATDLARYDWPAVSTDLDARGWAVLPRMLTEPERAAVAADYAEDGLFRARVAMARHGFGQGEYKYFAYPLPGPVAALRTTLYERLAPVANGWHAALGIDIRYPPTHAAFLARCHAAGQTRPTPLLLRYGPGDYNCLHQDLYGAHVFPLQLAILLSEPSVDFCGGEFVLTEQRPRMQSRPSVVPLRGGDAVVFAVNQRPVKGTRGFYRTVLRHGVSMLRSGHRHTLGIIFHDAA